ncbi:hypothetical protein [Nocardia gipuzkoensis]|uniref:hypothetical protein n=1 Tax=Nocardia gipuzkoensis TaxID=2749991 RepID=UPI00237DE534|nr:hypothetical protein [Nocardia gipuzkoensis]MDE1672664.1 hypothetical protein [Nocardia gipuzkoensis]
MDDEYTFDTPGFSDAATYVLMVVNELQWFRAGVAAGYFDPEGEKYFLAGRDELSRLVGQLENQILRYIQRFNPEKFSQPMIFQRLMAAMCDASTVELHNCIRLLLCTSDHQWRDELERLNQLVERMADNPSISLPMAEVDSVTWALSGADDLVAWIDFRKFYMHVAMSPLLVKPSARVHNKLVNYEDRLRDLYDVRAKVAEVAVRLTENMVAAAAGRLTRSVVAAQTTSRAKSAESPITPQSYTERYGEASRPDEPPSTQLRT